ncbi:21785_t:CDS:2, partial [Racocetra persica]
MNQDLVNLEQKVSNLEQIIVKREQAISQLREPEVLVESVVNVLKNLDKRAVFVKEFNWSDVKNDYDHANDKKKFIQDLETWFKKKPLTVAKEKGCTIKDVISKRTAYFLLGNYLINRNFKEAEYL